MPNPIPLTSMNTSILAASLPTRDSIYPTPSSDPNEVKSILHEPTPNLDSEALTSTDIRTDPILSSLAKHQARTMSITPTQKSTSSPFRAQPAPDSSGNVGPRMTKSAALRLGLDWDALKPKKEVAEGRVGSVDVGFENLPGHKRTGLNLTIASLALPSVLPRQTKSSQLKNGDHMAVPQPEKDRAAIAASNKARDLAERVQRRKSVALPASLSMPSIAPRTNRSSELRTGGPSSNSPRLATASSSLRNGQPPSAFGCTGSALTSTSVTNLAGRSAGEVTNAKSGEIAKTLHNRRQSMHAPVKSLGAPSIVPRLNKAALLRAPGTAPSTALPSSPLATVSNHSSHPPAQQSKPPRALPSTSSVKAQLSNTAPAPAPASLAAGPRQTKASTLRAGLGAKVLPGWI